MKYATAFLATIAAMAASATAAPAIPCPEAARFGNWELKQTQVTEGQQLTATYKQNCPNLADVKPFAFDFSLGVKNDGRVIKLYPTSPPPANPLDATFTFTVPDFYISPRSQLNAFLAEIQYNQTGPHGGQATHLYQTPMSLNITQG